MQSMIGVHFKKLVTLPAGRAADNGQSKLGVQAAAVYQFTSWLKAKFTVAPGNAWGILTTGERLAESQFQRVSFRPLRPPSGQRYAAQSSYPHDLLDLTGTILAARF